MTDPDNDSRPAEEMSIFDDMKPLPEYYSEKAIFGFSLFFSAMFGSVLLAMNLYRSPRRRDMWQVLVFGFLYTVMEGYIMSAFPRAGSAPSIFFNIIGAQLLRAYFWPAYLGKDTAYTNRGIWPPLIIGLVFFLVIGILAGNDAAALK